MKPLVLYHANCADGAGAALAAWMKYRDTAEYRPISYGQRLEEADVKDRDVYALDFSFKKDETLRIASMAKSLTIIDHHKSARDELKNVGLLVDVLGASDRWLLDNKDPPIHVRFDMNHSGAVLSWMYFHNTDVPSLFRYIEDRDLWRWNLPGSREINAALASYGGVEDFTRWHNFIGTWGARFEQRLCEEGAAILRAQEALIKLMALGSVPIEIGGLAACSVNASCLQSELGNFMLERQPQTNLAVVWFWDGIADKYRVSLRSRPEGPDVSELAKRYGGGGHKNAAGFERYELPWTKSKAPTVAWPNDTVIAFGGVCENCGGESCAILNFSTKPTNICTECMRVRNSNEGEK